MSDLASRIVAPLIMLAALASGGALAQGASKEQAQAALKEFETYAKNRNAHVRRAAVDTLGETDHHLVTSRLLEMLKDESSDVRDSAIRGLGRQTNVQGQDDLIARAWRGQNKPERLAILRAFKTSRPAKAFSVLQELANAKEWELRAAAVETVSVYSDEEGRATGVAITSLGDKEVVVRLAAIDALALLRHPKSQEGAIKALADSDWRIRASAIRLLRELRQKSAIDPLIALLKSENGRLLDDATAALVDLTGREVPGEYEKWKEWWDRVGDGFKLPTREEIAAAKKKAEAPEAGYAKSKRTPGGYAPYHGIKTRSRNMLFVIDSSASMAETITLNERNEAEVQDFRERYGDLTVKIDIAREELINLVASLPPYARFNIITFSSKVDLWQKTLVPADDGNKNDAIKWLARLSVANIVPVGRGIPGQTNTFEALNAAFGLVQGQELAKNSFKTDADTMFLLSDGMPTTGRIVETQTLLDYVQTVNKRAKMVLHCISFGSANKQFMETLAAQNGGQYVKLGS